MIDYRTLGSKVIDYYLQGTYQKPMDKLALDSTGVAYIRDLAEFSVKYALNTVWHDSNTEQPDGERMVVTFNDNGGEVAKFVRVNKNHKWAYLEDLLPQHVDEPVAPTIEDRKALDDYWQKIMEKEFGEIVCIPKLTTEQTTVLSDLIEESSGKRKEVLLSIYKELKK